MDATTTNNETTNNETTTRPVTPELSFSTFARPGEQTLSPLSPVTSATPEAPVEPVLLLDPSAANLTNDEQPLPSTPSVSPPRTPPRSASPTVTEPPAVIRHRFVRTFCAERAGSDTEDENEEGLPVPSSPVLRQIGRCYLSDDETVEEHVPPEILDSEADVADDEASDTEDEAEAEEAEEAPNGPVIHVPVWLFVATIIALVTYLFFIVYLLAWSCPAVPIRR